MDMKLNHQNLPFNGANVVNTNGTIQTSNQTSQNPVSLLYYPQYGGLPTTTTSADQRQTQLLNAMKQLEARQHRTNQTLSPQLASPVNIMMPQSLNPAAILSMATANADESGKDNLKIDSAIEAESKRQKRLELNRRSAQLSRQRKKERLHELERTISKLTSENQELLRANESLKDIIKRKENKGKSDTESKDAGRFNEQTTDAIQNVLSSLLEENRVLKQKLESAQNSKTSMLNVGAKLLEKRKFIENGALQSVDPKKQKN